MIKSEKTPFGVFSDKTSFISMLPRLPWKET